MTSMRPRLQPQLLVYDALKARAPAQPGPAPDHRVAGPVVDQPRPRPHVVEHGGELHDLAQDRDGALDAEVLVADDGLGDGLGLGPRRRAAEVAVRRRYLGQQVQGVEAAPELERQERRGQVLLRGADVVQERGEGPGGE